MGASGFPARRDRTSLARVRRIARFVSVLLMIAYASAATFDCERPDEAGSRLARAANAGGVPAPNGPHAHHADNTDNTDNTDNANNADSIPKARLSLSPTCLCGCSETRSTVGGEVSRLGVVVPRVHVARLLEHEHVYGQARHPAHVLDVALGIDPIPI